MGTRLSAKYLRCLYVILALESLIIGLLLTSGGVNKCKNISLEDLQSLEAKPLELWKYRLAVIIMSTSLPEGKLRREAIRETWLKDHLPSSSAVYPLFVVGIEGLDETKYFELMSENNFYNDVLMLSDLHDSYQNLTLKVLKSLQWYAENVYFDFALKCDDDTFVHVDKLLREMDALVSSGKSEKLYWGFFRGDAKVKMAGKWKESNWFLCDNYLPYAHGGGYILSYDLVKLIGQNANFLSLYHNEDVSVGVWLAPYNITRRHDPRFDTEYVSRGCRRDYIVTHKHSVENMYSLQKNVEEVGAFCSKDVQLKPSFQYNWNVLPSGCCKRTFDV